MSALRQYKELPQLSEIDPGIEPGWKYGIVLLQAEPVEKTKGGIILTDATKDNEQGAAVEALIVAISPTAFRHSDWEAVSDDPPYRVGDIIYTMRYPPGSRVTGRDGREYLLTKDESIDGKKAPAMTPAQAMQAIRTEYPDILVKSA